MAYQSIYDTPTEQSNPNRSFAGVRTEVSVEYLQLMKVNSYQNQYLRPFKTTVTGSFESVLGNMLDNYNGKVPPTAIAQACNDFIMPSSRVETYNNRPVDVTIPGGWQADRFAFILLVKTTSNGVETREMVTGYTDRYDTAGNGNQTFIAPDTVFYINSITKLGVRVINNFSIPVVNDSFSIFGGGIGNSAYGNIGTYKMTPSNLLQSSKISNIPGVTDLPKNTVIGTDYRQVSNSPSFVGRNFNSPTQVLSKIVEGAFSTGVLASTTTSIETDDRVNTVRSKVADPSIHRSAFMGVMMRLNGDRPVSTFTFGQLESYDPQLDFKTSFGDASMGTSQYTAPWDKPTIESTFALVVANMVTSLMTKSSLAHLEFRSTNMLGGYLNGFIPETHINNILGFDRNINMVNMIVPLQQTIDAELVPVVSKNNEIGYDIRVSADVNTDITIDIYLDGLGNEMERYVFPSFADAPISPMLTTDTDVYRGNARDIGFLMDVVTEKTDNYVAAMYGEGPMAPRPSPQGYSMFNNVNESMGYQPLMNQPVKQY